MSSLHARFAGLTLILLLLWGATSVQMHKKKAELLPTVEIAVEHVKAAGMTLTRTKSGNGPVDVGNDADETLHISLPEFWERDEVRGAPLEWIKGGEASLGFRRWSIPAHATVTFLKSDVWNKLIIRNISSAPLRLRVVTVDLERGSATTESTLVDDETLLKFQ